jgi:hypothetical protein
MMAEDIAIASGATALLTPSLTAVALLCGVALVALGLGTWLGRWYAPLLRGLNGIAPAWLGSLLLCGGGAVALAGSTALVGPGTRPVLLGWAAVALALTVPSLVAGLVLRAAHGRSGPGRTGWPRRVVRYLLGGQYPAGGPIRDPRAEPRAAREEPDHERC